MLRDCSARQHNTLEFQFSMFSFFPWLDLVRICFSRSPHSSMANAEQSPLLQCQYSEIQESRPLTSEFEEDETCFNDRQNAFNAGIEVTTEDDRGEDGVEEAHEDEDGGTDATPLLPIFSAAHLDVLPVYDLTHTLRSLVVARCETTLSWDQLRSPQVSKFLVKPIQQQIRSSHLSKAAPYALLANCLQFNKEVSSSPGISGINTTRALLCELLTIKLLRDFTTRELIDVLSYDFSPLQGMPCLIVEDRKSGSKRAGAHKRKGDGRIARVSALEIAIRTQAKHFLAHPLVVQHLEAIWAGKIIFHSVADSLNRPYPAATLNQPPSYGATGVRESLLPASGGRIKPSEQPTSMASVPTAIRRAVTLYDPREASVLKLSRLRVPRYRQFLSTCSFTVLLGLFVAVLAQRSLDITGLEVVFWLWSAGFMLDELVGFNEQGFSLYIMSFWNAFDLGILLLLGCYYCMRLYGVLAPDAQKHRVAHMAYDVLAANAVLLFPRLFSALDHYRYFSQLLIAFRMMAMDLVAVLTLIVISCSGFFVAFTLSFGDDGYDAGAVAYALFQMVMGFSPAAWTFWQEYNILGRAILTLFLFITHFLVITILVTVLTNSFMAVVRNANDEHQFLFAVNTISMVKSDALFPYIAPTNIVGWTLTPLRSFLPLRQFVRINRMFIRATHAPILLGIYTYERVIFRHAAFQPIQLVEQHRLIGTRGVALNAPGARLDLVNPARTRLREPSAAATQKDRALDEVFSRPFRSSTVHDTRKTVIERRTTSNVVNDWMHMLSAGGTTAPVTPVKQDQFPVEQSTKRCPSLRNLDISRQRQGRDCRGFSAPDPSSVSDLENFGKQMNARESSPNPHAVRLPSANLASLSEQIAAETLLSLCMLPNNNKNNNKNKNNDDSVAKESSDTADRSGTDTTSKDPQATEINAPQAAKRIHTRNDSSETIVYNPEPHIAKCSGKATADDLRPFSPTKGGQQRTGRQDANAPHAWPVMPPRNAFRSAPDLAGTLMSGSDNYVHRPTALSFDMGSDIGDNQAMGGGFIDAVPASFTTQMAMATGAGGFRDGTATSGEEYQSMMSKLMLARMNALEESFRDVVQELRGWREEGRRALSYAP